STAASKHLSAILARFSGLHSPPTRRVGASQLFLGSLDAYFFQHHEHGLSVRSIRHPGVAGEIDRAMLANVVRFILTA
ncbi:hypothetical protein, partial [Stenotrophomonas sp. Betaine-02u-23]|uniref:hypothetical protein n=1 Tax=Stenotrophomonas sp. Betaine-02u-23 TaxID=2058302 RepID=UPI001E6579A2